MSVLGLFLFVSDVNTSIETTFPFQNREPLCLFFPLQIYSKATIFRSSSLTELTLSIRLSNQLFTGAPLSSLNPTLTELLLLQGPFLR